MERLILSAAGRIISGDNDPNIASIYELLVSVSDETGSPVNDLGQASFGCFIHFTYAAGPGALIEPPITVFEPPSVFAGFYHLILNPYLPSPGFPNGIVGAYPPRLVGIAVRQFTEFASGIHEPPKLSVTSQGRTVISMGNDPGYQE